MKDLAQMGGAEISTDCSLLAMSKLAIAMALVTVFAIGCSEKKQVDELNTSLANSRADAKRAEDSARELSNALDKSRAELKRATQELEATNGRLKTAETSVARLEEVKSQLLNVSIAEASYAVSHGDYDVAQKIVDMVKAAGSDSEELTAVAKQVDAAKAKQSLEKQARSRNLKTIREVSTDQRGYPIKTKLVEEWTFTRCATRSPLCSTVGAFRLGSR